MCFTEYDFCYCWQTGESIEDVSNSLSRITEGPVTVMEVVEMAQYYRRAGVHLKEMSLSATRAQ